MPASSPSTVADRPPGPGETFTGVLQALYRKASWLSLERAIDNALCGDSTTLVLLTDAYLGRRVSGYYNSHEMNAAVNCLDYAFSRDIEHYKRLAEMFEARTPHVSRGFATGGLSCALWPIPPRSIALTGSRGATPVLIIGTTNDPATPYEWAIGLRRACPRAFCSRTKATVIRCTPPATAASMAP